MKPHSNDIDSKRIHCSDIDDLHNYKSQSLSSNVVDDRYTCSAISNDSSKDVLDCTTPLRSNGINHFLFIVNDEHTKQCITQVPDFLPHPDFNWKTEISNNVDYFLRAHQQVSASEKYNFLHCGTSQFQNKF